MEAAFLSGLKTKLSCDASISVQPSAAKALMKKLPQKQPAKVALLWDEVAVNEWTVSLLFISLTFPSMKAHFLKVQAG